MTKVLILRPNSSSKVNGIDSYCYALKNMFNDDIDISILPIQNYKSRSCSILHGIYKFSDLITAVRSSEADIVHINGYTSYQVFQAFRAAIKYNKKIVYTAHWHPYKMLRHPIGGKLFFNILLKPLIKKYANVVITLNNEDTEYFTGFHSNIIKVPHWMRFPSSSNDGDNSNKISNRILFVGRFNGANKGADHILSLPEGKFDIHIVGAGKIPDHRTDMTIHHEISDSELRNLYKSAAVVVVPSKYEAFSYVTLEALTSNTPVVISDRVRIGDYVQGISGVHIFSYGDYHEFADAVNKAIGDTVDVKTVFKIFDKDRIKHIYRRIYGAERN